MWRDDDCCDDNPSERCVRGFLTRFVCTLGNRSLFSAHALYLLFFSRRYWNDTFVVRACVCVLVFVSRVIPGDRHFLSEPVIQSRITLKSSEFPIIWRYFENRSGFDSFGTTLVRKITEKYGIEWRRLWNTSTTRRTNNGWPFGRFTLKPSTIFIKLINIQYGPLYVL